MLVDCRTEAEWTYVGVPSVEGTVFVEWNRQGGVRNTRFLDE
ncbi:MAG: rhodanese-like domain-containing protein, partial [Actinobacteria bacterium]|nr:rhodanese-like domain-containing protein [Actinomycetota bacterium]